MHFLFYTFFLLLIFERSGDFDLLISAWVDWGYVLSLTGQTVKKKEGKQESGQMIRKPDVYLIILFKKQMIITEKI